MVGVDRAHDQGRVCFFPLGIIRLVLAYIANEFGWLAGRFGLVATAFFVVGVASFSFILFSDALVPASEQARNQAFVNCPVPAWARSPLHKLGVLRVVGNTCQFHW